MTEQDRYIPGVPCWADASFADPAAAADFYGQLFGWTCENSMPASAPGQYFTARVEGRDVAALSSQSDAAPDAPAWNTYVWVDDADVTTNAAREAGGTVLVEPFDVFDAGRMSTFADPEGAKISVWEPARHRGSQHINDHGGVNFNNLYTRDPAHAATFYGAVFGWELAEVGPGMLMWALPTYGDFLEKLNPGMREAMSEMGSPEAFGNVVAAVAPIDSADSETPAHWGITFGVDDADAAVAAAVPIGGKVISEPVDLPWVRSAMLEDPQGAAFVISQFKPENKDLFG